MYVRIESREEIQSIRGETPRRNYPRKIEEREWRNLQSSNIWIFFQSGGEEKTVEHHNYSDLKRALIVWARESQKCSRKGSEPRPEGLKEEL